MTKNAFESLKQEFSPMHLALKKAQEAFDLQEVPVGAVIIDPKTKKVISQAHNEVEHRNDPCAHAEVLAIQAACKKLGSPRLVGLHLYVTLEPCPLCATAISFARIERLYYGAGDPKGGAVDHGPALYNQSSCHHRPEVISSLDEEACQNLLWRFFREKR